MKKIQKQVNEFPFSWAQLFEGRLAFNPGLNLTGFLFLLLKNIFSDNFLCYF